MIATLSLLIFSADIVFLHNVWFFKASLAVLVNLKITLFIVSLPKGSLPKGNQPRGRPEIGA